MLLNFFPGFVSKIEKLLLTQLIKNVLLWKTVQNVFFSRQMSLRTGDRGERQYMVVNVPGFVLEINLQHNMRFHIAYTEIQNLYFFIQMYATS